MTPILITPPNDNRKTGGYIYNARIAAILEPQELLRHEFIPPEKIVERLTAADLGGRATVVFDSLYLNHADELTAARRRTGVRGQRWILLTHLLPSQETDGRRERESEAKALPLFDAAIVPSRHMKAVLAQSGFRPNQIVVCYPGTDRSRRLITGTQDATPQILTVANWIPRKNIEGVLAALRRLESLSWNWHIVGFADPHSAYVQRLQEEIRGVRPAERIVCHGTLESHELDRLWADAALFVLATRFESYGMVFAEALSHGVPVVAPRVGGIPEIVESGRTGLLYEPAKPSALRACLQILLSDAELRRSFAQAAATEARSLPRWKDSAHRFAAVCHGV